MQTCCLVLQRSFSLMKSLIITLRSFGGAYTGDIWDQTGLWHREGLRRSWSSLCDCSLKLWAQILGFHLLHPPAEKKLIRKVPALFCPNHGLGKGSCPRGFSPFLPSTSLSQSMGVHGSPCQARHFFMPQYEGPWPWYWPCVANTGDGKQPLEILAIHPWCHGSKWQSFGSNLGEAADEGSKPKTESTTPLSCVHTTKL